MIPGLRTLVIVFMVLSAGLTLWGMYLRLDHMDDGWTASD
jgi:hypothetical protein